MKKKIISVLIIISVVLFVFVHVHKEHPEQESIKIGMSVYDINDVFISSIVFELQTIIKQYEQEEGIRIDLDISDASYNQRVQNEQVERYIDLNYDAICVNIVDRSNVSAIADAASESEIPIIFFNREPVNEDIESVDTFYYIGSDAQQAAVLQADVIVSYLDEQFESVDKNGDGAINYVMLEGEIGHQDTIFRSQKTIEEIQVSGYTMTLIDSASAEWKRDQGDALMESWIQDYETQIEMVISNNDEMALGAIDALYRHNLRDIPVFGIDATASGKNAVMKGTLSGTVDGNASGYAQTMLEKILYLQDGYSKETKYIEIEMKKFIWEKP